LAGTPLHIVSFDIPYPANYGGVIDVFWKLRWLHEAGVEIHLHCFEYGRAHSTELNKYCKEVYYYQRKTGIAAFFSFLPYTVKSRISKELEQRLVQTKAPILCEVLHTCYVFNNPALKDRQKIYRHSNLEHEYYYQLAKAEKNILKKLYLYSEARKLKRFEKIISKANLVLAVNEKDAAYYRNEFPTVNVQYLPSFHSSARVNAKIRQGEYILFHGNLGIAENHLASVWLLKHVFSQIHFPIIIAGLNPNTELEELCALYPQVKLLRNLKSDEMSELIQNAHIHVLYTHQATGLKLKLLQVLFEGRFVICNDKMVSGAGITNFESIRLCQSPTDFVNEINRCIPMQFTEMDLKKRVQGIHVFNNQENAKKLKELLV